MPKVGPKTWRHLGKGGESFADENDCSHQIWEAWEKNNKAEMLNRNKSAFLPFFPQNFGESRASWKKALFLG